MMLDLTVSGCYVDFNYGGCRGGSRRLSLERGEGIGCWEGTVKGGEFFT